MVIDINGIPFFFGWSAFKEMTISMRENGLDNEFDGYEKGMYYGFVHGAKEAGKEPPFTFDEMLERFEHDGEFHQMAIEAFGEQFPSQKKRMDSYHKVMKSMNPDQKD